MSKIRTAVIGAGKMGAIHAKVYSKIEECELVAIVDSDRKRAEKLAAQYNCRALTECDSLPDQVDAVTVAVPRLPSGPAAS